MKTTSEHKKRVGLFVTIGICVICTSIFFVGGSEIFKSQFYLKAQFPQIQGLTEGSIVSLSGIKVGNIESIQLLPQTSAVEVTLKIEKSFSTKITEGSLIEIRTQGALGDKYLFITPGPLDHAPIAENTILPVAPNTDIISVFSEKGDRAAVIFEILEDLHKITQALNSENHLAQLPKQTDLALRQLNSFLGEATTTLRELRGGVTSADGSSKISAVVSKLDTILNRIEKGEGTLGALINDTSIHDQLKTLLGGANATQQTRSLLRNSIKHQDTESSQK